VDDLSIAFDKDGYPIDPLEWGILMNDREYSQIGETYIAGAVRVSTVWLGINHNFSGGPPKTFETMFFGGPLDCWTFGRYTTEGAAKEAHDLAVKMWHDPGFMREVEFLVRRRFTGRKRHGWVKWCRDWRRHVS
jgi:hypothetical protein